MTSSGPSVARTASRWASFRSARYWSGVATAMPSMLAAAPEAQGPAEGRIEDEHRQRFGDPAHESGDDAALARCRHGGDEAHDGGEPEREQGRARAKVPRHDR